jgi:hypothetical protein
VNPIFSNNILLSSEICKYDAQEKFRIIAIKRNEYLNRILTICCIVLRIVTICSNLSISIKGLTMGQHAIRIDSELFKTAKSTADVEHRSVPKQIEYWAKIGRISIENPDLSYKMIHDILLGLSQAENGETEDYNFGSFED